MLCASLGLLQVPHIKTKNFGDRSFRSCGPRQWNLLPPELRDARLSLPAFKCLLKTHLFKCLWWWCSHAPLSLLYIFGRNINDSHYYFLLLLLLLWKKYFLSNIQQFWCFWYRYAGTQPLLWASLTLLKGG